VEERTHPNLVPVRQGTRIKFGMNQNSIKAYDQAHTENRAVCRRRGNHDPPHGIFSSVVFPGRAPEREKKGRRLRQGNADLLRVRR
jgi:hypothetical protein